jgi:hypothetical protein
LKRKTYTPYRVSTETINRFRGIVNPENQQTIAKEYVGSSDNAISFRVGELTHRPGQELSEEESSVSTGAVHSAGVTGSIMVLSTGPDVFVDAIASRLRRVSEYFGRRISRTSIVFPSSITCSDLWADNPEFSQYERAGADSFDPFASSNPISACWTIGGGAGGWGGGLPELPGPEDVLIPEIPPIIPEIPPFETPEEEDNSPNPCRLKSLSFNKQRAEVSYKTTPFHDIETDTVILVAEGSGFYGKVVSAEPRLGICSVSYRTSDTRSGPYSTTQTTEITISPVIFYDEFGELDAEKNKEGVYHDTVRVVFKLCGKEYDANIDVVVVRHIGTELLAVTYGAGVSVPPTTYIGLVAKYDLPSSVAGLSVQDVGEKEFYIPYPALSFRPRNSTCSASGDEYGYSVPAGYFVHNREGSTALMSVGPASFTLTYCGNTNGYYNGGNLTAYYKRLK